MTSELHPSSRKPAEAAASRMRPLAKLPVFWDLGGKPVVVAGGTAAAAWKAELVAAAGARVTVYATEVSEEMAQLLARGCETGEIAHVGRDWQAGDLAGAAMALADAEGDDEARAFAGAARSAGVPFNVIDNPAYCQFQFGAIVNRSPAVIAISTDGAAPILGQAIRRRIETLLPPSLSDWAGLARDVRERVMARVPKGAARRRFWEALADRAFGAPPSSADRQALDQLMTKIGSGASHALGRVTLVGAGPGDAELLTLKAVRALQSADIILYDDLVSADVLELARREAKRMMVGKRGHRESCRQSDINDLMVKLALQGKHVVRLKSGDPMIFGRAGEEIERLEAEGITVSVVPGITSASAMAAELGVSLTHRSCAQSLRFITGHSRSGALPDDLDWRGLADQRTTLIVYMGGRTACALAAELIAHGLDTATPVVAVSSVSRESSRRWVGDLASLATAGVPETLASPVLIGIGATFAAVRAVPATERSPLPEAAAIAV